MIVALTLVPVFGKKSAAVSKADAMKARYFYYEAMRQNAMGNNDATFECLRRATQLDPDNVEAAFLIGMMRVKTWDEEIEDSLADMRTLGQMRRLLDKYPDDIDEWLQYAATAGYLNKPDESVNALEQLVRRYPDNSLVLAYLSQAYSNQGSWSKAADALKEYERVEGRSPAVTMQKMSLMLAGKDSLGALREVDDMIGRNAGDYKLRVLKGNLYEVMSLPDSASAMYMQAHNMAPEASEPMVALMDIYRQKGDSAAYDKMLYDVLLTEDLDVQSKTMMLAEYLQRLMDSKNDTERGDYLFSVLRREYPHDPEVMNLAARYSAAKKDYAAAAEEIQYALDMDRSNQNLWLQLMSYLASDDKVAEALKVYNEADSVIEMEYPMKVYGAMLMQNEKRYDDAKKVYVEVLQNIAPDLDVTRPINMKRDLPRDISLSGLDALSDVLTSMGDCDFAALDTTQAFLNYRNALELNPDNVLAANNYAYFLSKSGGDLDKALQLSKRTITGDNAENPTYLDTYAWILYLKGERDEAIEIQKKVLELMEKQGRSDADTMDHYGDMLYSKGNKEEALEYWRKAIEADPEGHKELADKIDRLTKELKEKK